MQGDELPKKSRKGLIIGIVIAVLVIVIIIVIVVLVIRSRPLPCKIPIAPTGVTSLKSPTLADLIGYSFILPSTAITAVLVKVTNDTSQTFIYPGDPRTFNKRAMVGKEITDTVVRNRFTPPITGTPTTFQLAFGSTCGTGPYSAPVAY